METPEVKEGGRLLLLTTQLRPLFYLWFSSYRAGTVPWEEVGDDLPWDEASEPAKPQPLVA